VCDVSHHGSDASGHELIEDDYEGSFPLRWWLEIQETEDARQAESECKQSGKAGENNEERSHVAEPLIHRQNLRRTSIRTAGWGRL
jgi:hypothetical protein